MSVIPDLQRRVTAPLMYVYAATGTFIIGEIAPDPFGSLHKSAQTLEGWVDVMNTVMPKQPFASASFCPARSSRRTFSSA